MFTTASKESACQGILLQGSVEPVHPVLGRLDRGEDPLRVDVPIPEQHDPHLARAGPDEQPGRIVAGERVEPEGVGLGVVWGAGHHPVYRSERRSVAVRASLREHRRKPGSPRWAARQDPVSLDYTREQLRDESGGEIDEQLPKFGINAVVSF